MIKKLSLLVLMCGLSPTLHAGPTDADMQKALKADYAVRETQVMNIFRAWIASGDEASLNLLNTYLMDRVVYPKASVDSFTRNKLVEEITVTRSVVAYPTALAYARKDLYNTQKHLNLLAAVAEAVPSSAALRAALIKGDASIGLEGIIKNGDLQLRPNQDSLTISKALFDAKALPESTKVRYTLQSRSLPLDAKMLDLMVLPKLAAAGGAYATLVGDLMQIRSQLNTKTIPTREAFTQEFIRVMETSDPETALRLQQAARNAMVADEVDVYDRERKIRRVLTIDRSDSADLNLARYLLDKPVVVQIDPKKAKPSDANSVGLRDVELIHWTGPEEKSIRKLGGKWERSPQSANFVPWSWVQDAPGMQIQDRLAPREFMQAVGNDVSKTAIWRTPEAYDRHNLYSRAIPSGSASAERCDYAPLLTSAKR